MLPFALADGGMMGTNWRREAQSACIVEKEQGLAGNKSMTLAKVDIDLAESIPLCYPDHRFAFADTDQDTSSSH